MIRWFCTVVVLLLIMFCAERISPTNPHDREFTGGDYSLYFHWDDPNTTDSTLLPFIPYVFQCETNGEDKYQSFTYSITPAISSGSSKRYGFPGIDTLPPFPKDTLYSLSLTARRKNGTDTTISFQLTVINPLVIDKQLNELYPDHILKCFINDTTGLFPSLSDSLYLISWMQDTLPAKKLPVGDTLLISVHSGDSIVISAHLLENTTIRLRLDTIGVTIPTIETPTVQFDHKVWDVPVNEKTSITADASGFAYLLWVIDTTDIIRTTTATLDTTWEDTTTVSIVVTAFNEYDKSGTSDTITVSPRPYPYSLQIDTFPNTIQARDTATWTVTATENKNDSPVVVDSITYLWSIEPPGDYDTTLDHGSCSIYLIDSIAPFQLSVVAVKDTNSSWTKRETIIVRAWRPSLKVSEKDDSLKLNESMTFHIQVSDADGTVEQRYYKTSFGDTAAQSFIGDSVVIPFTHDGLQSVSFWCTDNKKFSSDTEMVNILVTSMRPYFDVKDQTISAFTGDSVTLSVTGETDNIGTSITGYFWNLDNGTTVTTTNGTHTYVFSEVGTHSVVVRCKDSQDSVSTDAVEFTIHVSKGYPKVDSAVCLTETAYINQPVSIALTASDSNETLIAATVAYGDTSVTFPFDPPVNRFDSTLQVLLTDTGAYQFNVTVMDNDSLVSRPFVIDDSIHILPGRPTLAFTPDTVCWIYDTNTYSGNATDPNGSVVSYFFRWNEGEPFESNSSGNFPHSFPDSGVYTLAMYVIDNDGLCSDTLEREIHVRSGLPVVTVDFFTPIWIYDDTTYIVNGNDDNGRIISRGIRWDDQDTFKIESTSTFTHEFETEGNHTIQTFVIDEDGLSSDTLETTVRVERGDPSITGIATANPDFGDTLYIGDTLTFTVTVEDPNNENEWVIVSWDGDENFEDSLHPSGNTAVFHPVFDNTESGNHTARFRVIDRDGFSDDSLFDFTLQLGRPSVRLLTILPPPNELFVNDDITFRVRASDGNGDIRKIAINWNGGSSAGDSLTFTGTNGLIDTSFTYAYDTTGGDYTVNVWTFDDDTVKSTVIDTIISIRKGAPVLWGDEDDTLWVIVNNGPGDYYYHVNHFDTNGTIDTFYYSASSNIASASAFYRADSALITVDELDMNQITGIRYIWVEDNDKFIRGGIDGGRFIIFADSAPVAPSLGSATIDGDSVKFVWENADVKDGDATEFRIMCDTSNDPSTVISDFSIRQKDGTEFFIWYHPPATGRYRFKVVARDARGTQSTSLISSYFDFTLP